MAISFNPLSGQFDIVGTGGGGGGSGITSINTDSTAAQTLTAGSSGTDFAIVDNGTGDHAFNIPSASATARGLVTTGTQTFAGAKTFTGNFSLTMSSPAFVIKDSAGIAGTNSAPNIALQSSNAAVGDIGFLASNSTTMTIKNRVGNLAFYTNNTSAAAVDSSQNWAFPANVTLSALTASTALVTDGSKNVASSSTTGTELGYVHGVTSAIQTQLNAKAATSAPTFTTSITFGNYRVDPSFHDFGNSGASITLDLSQASCAKTTFNNATPAITLSNGQAGGAYRLMFAQDGTGSRVPSFVTTINYGVLGAPTFSTGASKVDFMDIWTPDGSTWYCMGYVLGY